MIKVKPVILSAGFSDDEGMLVFRDNALLAVLSRWVNFTETWQAAGTSKHTSPGCIDEPS